jgi:hypothetical protein
MQRNHRNSLAVIAILGITGVIVMLQATRFGVGVLPDSTVYFDAARNLASGRGLVVISGKGSELVPLNHYPPMYSVLLAVAVKSGFTIETIARWLNAVLFGLNIFLVGYAIDYCVRGSFWFPLFGAFLVLTAPDVLALHSVAMTEPLFIVLTLAGLLSLARYLEGARRWFLGLAAILIAASCLTRFVGVATIAGGCLGLMLQPRLSDKGEHARLSFSLESWRRRLFDTLIFGALCCLPMAILSIRNRLAAGGASDRQLAFHPVKLQQVVPAFSTVAQWMLLGKVRTDLRFIAFIIEMTVLLLGVVWWSRQRTENPINDVARPTALPYLLLFFVFAYVALLLVVMTFLEADDVLDARSLLPVHFAAVILGACLAKRFYAVISRSTRLALMAFALLLAGSHAFRATRWFVMVQADGQGYASRAWKESPAMAEVLKLPAATLIYTNAIDAVHYLSGRRALDIPPRIIKGTGRANEQFETQLERMKLDLQVHNGVLVYFRAFPERQFLPTEDDLRIRLPFAVVPLEDAAIFKAGSAP